MQPYGLNCKWTEVMCCSMSRVSLRLNILEPHIWVPKALRNITYLLKIGVCIECKLARLANEATRSRLASASTGRWGLRLTIGCSDTGTHPRIGVMLRTCADRRWWRTIVGRIFANGEMIVSIKEIRKVNLWDSCAWGHVKKYFWSWLNLRNRRWGMPMSLEMRKTCAYKSPPV